MIHKAWSSIEEVPYCFSRSSVKFQGHTAVKIVEFDPNWAFPDCNSSLNSPMAIKCCTKFWNSKGEMSYCFPRSSIKFQGHTGQNITDFDPNWAFPDYRPVAAFKSLRFALLFFAGSPSLWDKQRVLMHGHQGWNVRHGLCHIYMIYVYIWVVYSFCLFCCLFIIVTTQFVAPELDRHLTLCLTKYLNYFSWM